MKRDIKNLRAFEFYGNGEFAKFDTWDEGLTSKVIKEVSFSEAHKIEKEMKEHTDFDRDVNLRETPSVGIYEHVIKVFGKRRAMGFVIAENEKSAKELLKKFDKQFRVVKFKIKRYRNPQRLRIFEISGTGNFNKYFGWDEGLESSIMKEVSFRYAKIIGVQMAEDYKQINLPEAPEIGIFYDIEEEKGIRSVYGFVIEKNLKTAKKLLKEFSDSFVVIEQEEE